MEVFEGSNPAPRVFELRGELDMDTVPRLRHAVAPALGEPGDLLFDLSDLSFMDTSGIHAILQIAEPLAEGALLLTAPQHIVKRVLEITNLDGNGNIRVLDISEEVVVRMVEENGGAYAS
jgi:anti-anti-sigma factor